MLARQIHFGNWSFPFDRRRLASISIVVATTTLVVIVLHLLSFDPLRKAQLYVRDFLASPAGKLRSI
ncbi:MAG: hypothetical protein M3372_03400, partial [Verrucomicrobiota bacterium]|nr:hypothetical protein [Verrucomicrobiota bacterium]